MIYLQPSYNNEKNLAYAAQAIRHVKQMGIIPMNKGNPNGCPEWDANVDDIRTIAYQQSKHLVSYDDKMDISAKLTALFKMGYCTEMAEIAYLFLKRNLGLRKVDIAYIKEGDHVFVVIGRQDNSTHDYKTWGEKAVVCDPWSDDYYPVDQLEQRLMDYKDRILSAFNPKEQSIRFKKQDRIKLPDLESYKQNVVDFHALMENKEALEKSTHILNTLTLFYQKKASLADLKKVSKSHGAGDEICQTIAQIECHKSKNRTKT